MNARHYAKLVHESEYVAEVDVELIYTDEGWSPYSAWMTPATLTPVSA